MKPLFTLAFAIAALQATAQLPITVHEAVALARSHRPAIAAAEFRLRQALAERRALAAYPATRLHIGYTSDPEVGGSDEDLVLSQPLDIFGRTAAARRAGNAAVARAEAELRLAAGQVQSEVIAAYIAAAEATELARSASSVQETYQRLYDATQVRVAEGVIPGFHLSRVGLDLDQSKLLTGRRIAEASASRQRLSALIGADSRLDGLRIPNLDVPDVDEKRLVTDRADLLLLAAEEKAAEANVRTTRAAGLPELELQGRRSPWQQRPDRYGLRIQLSIPLIDHGKARAESTAASSRLTAAQRALADASMVALGEVRAARTELHAAAEQVGQSEKLLDRARQLVERLRPGLTEQATTLLEVLDASRVLRDIELGYVEARARLARAQADYLRATGQLIEVPR